MSTQFFHKYGKFIVPIIVLLLSSIIIFIWFRKGLMFAGGEEGLPFYNIPKHFSIASQIWHDNNAGFPKVILLPRIPYFWAMNFLSTQGLSGVFLQALTFFLLIFTGCLSVFYLIKETVANEIKGGLGKLVPFLAGIFYLFNPYSMTQVWGRGLYAQFFGFALIPLFLLLYILAVKRKNLVYIILAIVGSFIFSPAYVFPSNVIALWIPIFIYSGFWLMVNRKNKKELLSTLGFLAFLGMFWLLINFWWFLPFVRVSGTEFSSAINNVEHNLGSLRGVSREFRLSLIIRLMQRMYFYTAKLYGDIYLTPAFKLLSWVIPIVSLFSISVFRKLRNFLFYVSMFLISLFLSLGSNFPTKPIFEFLFTNIPFFQVFRNPYEKLGLLFLIAYVPFFAIGTVEISSKISKKIKFKYSTYLSIIFILLVTAGIFLWPMWKGIFAGGYAVNSWVKVPEDYKQADDWLKSQPGEFRIMQMPLNPGDGIRYLWPHSYQGLEAGEFLFTASSVGSNVGGNNKIYYNVLLERFGTLAKNAYGPDPDITHSEFRSKSFLEELAKLNVRYIILHHDVDEKLSRMEDAETTEQFLSKQSRIKKVKTFGKLDIYSVDIPKNIGFVYFPESVVVSEKVNSSYYRFEVKKAKKTTRIYLLELYDPGWTLVVDGKEVSEHGKAFSYANSWAIDKSGDFSGVIRYKPQDYVRTGTKISVESGIALGIILLGLLLAKGYRIWRKQG